jgi:hypothetical protein
MDTRPVVQADAERRRQMFAQSYQLQASQLDAIAALALVLVLILTALGIIAHVAV